jgi:hypothetical protein
MPLGTRRRRYPTPYLPSLRRDGYNRNENTIPGSEPGKRGKVQGKEEEGKGKGK